MGCSPFANSRFQMGVTVMGFVEHFGHSLWCERPASKPVPSGHTYKNSFELSSNVKLTSKS